MSDRTRPGARWSRCRQAWTRARHVLDSWYPQVPIALATAPLGLLLLASATRAGLGVGPTSVEIVELERSANSFQFTPIVEAAMGFSLIAISIGLSLRSRLAWLWAVLLCVGSLSLRVVEEPPDLGIAAYLVVVVVALLVHRNRFRTQSLTGSSVFALTALATFLMWATLGTLRLGAHFAPPIRDLTTAVYFTVVTFTSVGYGDIVASDRDARLFVSLMIVVGVIVGATAFSTILLPLMGGRLRQVLGGRLDVDRSNHFVIVGKSTLARNTATELESRGQKVTLVLDRNVDEDFYKKRDVVVGDPTDLAVLKEAGTEKAVSVLALSTDDAENGFVILGVNEINPAIRTVAALNDGANESRVKRTQPSVLLSLQSLGGELLAMALTGERVDVEMLRRVLQIPGAGPDPSK